MGGEKGGERVGRDFGDRWVLVCCLVGFVLLLGFVVLWLGE